jgi:hypothetical protein
MRSRKDNLKLCQERNRKEREGTGRIRIGRDNENAGARLVPRDLGQSNTVKLIHVLL